MIQSMSLRWGFAMTIAIGVGATACSSGPESTSAVPDIANGALSASDFACVKTRVSEPDPSPISAALASACGCNQDPAHIAGCAERWSFVDCTGASPACVNNVLDNGGYRASPYFANTIAVGTCAPFTVVYDPCSACRGGGVTGPGTGPGATLGDYCPKYAAH